MGRGRWLVLVVATSVGCGGNLAQVKISSLSQDNGFPTVASFPSQFRGVYFAGKQSTDALRYCAEPFPDTATSVTQEINQKLQLKELVEVGVDEKVALTALELAGRSQLVLLTREYLYRVCEFGLNNPGATVDMMKALYSKALDQIAKIAEAIKSESNAKVAEKAIDKNLLGKDDIQTLLFPAAEKDDKKDGGKD